MLIVEVNELQIDILNDAAYGPHTEDFFFLLFCDLNIELCFSVNFNG